MKLLLFTTALAFTIFACQTPSEASRPTQANSQQNSPAGTPVQVRSPSAVFITLSPDRIEKLKKQAASEDDFYTEADDANAYYSGSYELLEQRGIPIVHVSDTSLLQFGNQFFIRPDTLNPWSVVYFTAGKAPLIVAPVDLEKRLDYFGGTHAVRTQNSQDIYELKAIKTTDLNSDGIADTIAVYQTSWTEPVAPTDYLHAKVVVRLSSQPRGPFQTLVNDRIIEDYVPENTAVGFSELQVKGAYFTIEQVNSGNGITVQVYTTFKWDERQKALLLHRHTTITNQHQGQDAGADLRTDYTPQSFGRVGFEAYDPKRLPKP
ncbi:MAG: hypothetical protein EOP52_03195 [Sphingobacteriales bacterium]|nr:MAG: hypothetical protein EOP52_03195 [Sphingobacteriales bacterium]